MVKDDDVAKNNHSWIEMGGEELTSSRLDVFEYLGNYEVR